MYERGSFQEVREILNSECFVTELNRVAYESIVEIADSGDRVNSPAVMAKAMSALGDKFDFVEWANYSTADYDYDPLAIYQHAARLHDLSVRRKFGTLGQYLLSCSTSEREDILDITNDAIEQLTSLFKSSSTEISTLDDGLKEVNKIIYDNQLDEKPITGTPTGFRRLDEKMGGLQKSDLTIVAGETSQGKTSFATSIMKNAASKGGKIAMYSMEMKQSQIAARLLSMESGIPSSQIMYSRLSDVQLQMTDKGIGRMTGLPIYFDDRSTSSIDMILSSIRYMKAKFDIDGAVVDYLQILNVNMKGSSKEQQMGDVSRRLKNIAKELDVWVIAISQLNRDSLNPVPSISRIRDSGQIAEAADNVIFVYRPEVYGKSFPGEFSNISTDGMAMIDVAKGRNTGLFKFVCGFNASKTLFYDLSDAHIPIAEEEEQPF